MNACPPLGTHASNIPHDCASGASAARGCSRDIKPCWFRPGRGPSLSLAGGTARTCCAPAGGLDNGCSRFCWPTRRSAKPEAREVHQLMFRFRALCREQTIDQASRRRLHRDWRAKTSGAAGGSCDDANAVADISAGGSQRRAGSAAADPRLPAISLDRALERSSDALYWIEIEKATDRRTPGANTVSPSCSPTTSTGGGGANTKPGGITRPGTRYSQACRWDCWPRSVTQATAAARPGYGWVLARRSYWQASFTCHAALGALQL